MIGGDGNHQYRQTVSGITNQFLAEKFSRPRWITGNKIQTYFSLDFDSDTSGEKKKLPCFYFPESSITFFVCWYPAGVTCSTWKSCRYASGEMWLNFAFKSTLQRRCNAKRSTIIHVSTLFITKQKRFSLDLTEMDEGHQGIIHICREKKKKKDNWMPWYTTLLNAKSPNSVYKSHFPPHPGININCVKYMMYCC